MERLEKIAIEATEQSGRGDIPVILKTMSIEEIFQSGLHEYLTDCLDDINELGSRMQRAYLGTV